MLLKWPTKVMLYRRKLNANNKKNLISLIMNQGNRLQNAVCPPECLPSFSVSRQKKPLTENHFIARKGENDVLKLAGFMLSFFFCCRIFFLSFIIFLEFSCCSPYHLFFVFYSICRQNKGQGKTEQINKETKTLWQLVAIHLIPKAMDYFITLKNCGKVKVLTQVEGDG